jgi:hypothetical protein
LASFSDLLKLLSRNEQASVRQTNQAQKEILDLYVQLHADVVSHLNTTTMRQITRKELTPTARVAILRNAALADWLRRRINVLNKDIGKVFDKVAPQITALVEQQVKAESRRLGMALDQVSVSDPRLIEKGLADAFKIIEKWNGNFTKETLAQLRVGILKGEDYRALAARVSNSGTSSEGATPIARARFHALANVRYAVVHAANSGRQSAYTQAQSDSGLKVQKMWYADISSCCWSCAQLHGQIADLDKEFEWRSLDLSLGVYKDRLFHPPMHPNCRCRIIPITEDVLAATDIKKILADRQARLAYLSKRLVA